MIKKHPSPILLSVDFFRHLKTLVPLYHYLAAKRLNPWLVTDINSLSNNLKNFKLPQANSCFLASWLTPGYYEEHQQEWQQAVRDLHRRAQRQNQFLRQLIFLELSPLIKYGLMLNKLYLEAGEQLFLKLKPRAVVVIADYRLTELTLSVLAKKHQVFSLLVSPRTIVFDEEPSKFNLTDFVAVAGQQAYEKLRQLKVPAKRIKIFGDPSYEYYARLRRNFSPAQLYRQLGIKDLKKKIVIFTSDRVNTLLSAEEKRQSLTLAYQAVQAVPGTVLVVKPHPTENRRQLLAEIQSWGIKAAVVSDNDRVELFDLVEAAAVVILNWSMMGLEVALLNRPVIIVNPAGKNYDQIIPYVSSHGAVAIKNAQELQQQLKILCQRQHPQTQQQLRRAKKFASYYVKEPDGRVCQQLVNFLLKAS